MPTYREGYDDGFERGYRLALEDRRKGNVRGQDPERFLQAGRTFNKPKRKLSAWNKYVKANSKKPRFRYRNGKLNLKKMAVAFRKTQKRGGKRK